MERPGRSGRGMSAGSTTAPIGGAGPHRAPGAGGSRRRASAWVAGLLLAAVVVATAGSAAAQSGRGERALGLVNEARAAEGLAPLTLDERLTATARVHAEDMEARDYYAHASPEGETVRDRFLERGGGEWRLVAENIARCEGCPTPPGPERVRAFQEGWMDSPEHRATILDPGLERFGYALAWGDGTTYGVQTFAGPGRPDGVAEDAGAEGAPPAAIRERALARVNEARGAQGVEPLSADAALDGAAGRLVEAGALREGQDALDEALERTDAGGTAVAMLGGQCGGCGAMPRRADAANFVSDWLEDPSLSGSLLDPEARTLGFALGADGQGRKAAVALVGGP